MSLFSRVGVPKEILTDQDQGTKFTSQLLEKLYQLSQGHRDQPLPPTDRWTGGRFNGMLKAMLRKCVTKEGKNWDRLLLYVFFAHREVPQATTGFSPFELLYRRAVQGPLDILKETWEAEKESEESVVLQLISAGEASRNDGVGEGEFYQGEGSAEGMV